MDFQPRISLKKRIKVITEEPEATSGSTPPTSGAKTISTRRLTSLPREDTERILVMVDLEVSSFMAQMSIWESSMSQQTVEELEAI